MSILRDRSVFSLVIAQFVSVLGSQMSIVAIPWFVLTTTGSPGLMTLVLVAEALPLAVFGIPAGVIVDRCDLKKLMVWLDVGSAVVTAAIPLLYLSGSLEFWMILVLAALLSTLRSPRMSARLTLVPILVGEDEVSMDRVNAVLQAMVQLTIILGPITAGMLIPVIGNEYVILADAATFVISAAVITAGVRYRRSSVPTRATSSSDALREGIRYAWSQPLIRTMILVGVSSMFGFYAVLGVGLPVFTRDVLHAGPETLGWLFGCWGAGAIVGLFAQSRLARRGLRIRGFIYSGSLLALALALSVPPLMRGIVPTAAAFFVAGAADGPLTAVTQTILQLNTPARLRGRVFASYIAATMTATPIALLAFAPVVERWGSIPLMWTAAGAFWLCAGVALGTRSVRTA